MTSRVNSVEDPYVSLRFAPFHWISFDHPRWRPSCFALYDHTLCTPLFVLFSFPRIWCSCFTKRAIIIIIELWRLVWWEKPHGLVRTRHWIYKFLKINVAVLCPCYFQKNRGLPPYSPSVLQIVNFIYCSTWKQRKPVTFFVHHSLLSRLKQNARKKKKTSSAVCKANFPSSRARYFTLITFFSVFQTTFGITQQQFQLRLQSLNDR